MISVVLLNVSIITFSINTLSKMILNEILSITTLVTSVVCHFNLSRYAERRIFFLLCWVSLCWMSLCGKARTLIYQKEFPVANALAYFGQWRGKKFCRADTWVWTLRTALPEGSAIFLKLSSQAIAAAVEHLNSGKGRRLQNFFKRPFFGQNIT
jgi:hypothetical protein